MASVKETLLRHVKSCKSTLSISNAIDIVDHLRSNYSDYNQYRYMRLLYSVQNALDSLKTDNKAAGLGKKEIKAAVTNHHISETNVVRWKKPWLPQEINRFAAKMADGGLSPIPDVKWEDVGALDHVDALTDHGDESVRKQLQNELDGAEQRRGVFVIGATNRPEEIDSALLRPGRFGNHIYIPVPSPDGRVSILKALARRMENLPRFRLMPIDASVNLSSIARSKACTNFSGADLAALQRENYEKISKLLKAA
ncbi:hypothetical protein TSUD_122320 [Trifolium subterraneum]|nr:hypothetical protein TSUD_122320 [Trifolium subterraneum]